MVRRILMVIACVSVFLVSAASYALAAEAAVGVVVNGEKVVFPDAKPFIDENARTQVPVRFVSEALGAEVIWDAALKKVTVILNGKEVVLKIGQKDYEVNGQSFQMDTAALLVEARTFVPLRFVSEALGANVIWEKSTKTVSINIEKNLVLSPEPTPIPAAITSYYDKISFNKANDVDEYERMSIEKSKEFVMNMAEQLSFVKEEDKYYIQFDYPKIPEGYYWKLSISLVKSDGEAIRYSTITHLEEYRLPEEGSFKKEVVLTSNVEDIVFYSVEISINQVNSGNNGLLNINYSIDESRVKYLLDSSTVVLEDYSDKFDYERMFRWIDFDVLE